MAPPGSANNHHTCMTKYDVACWFLFEEEHCFTTYSNVDYLFSATTNGHVIKMSIPALEYKWRPPLHEQMINHMTMVSTNEDHAFLLTCSDDKWVKVAGTTSLQYDDGGIAQFYVGAKVTCITGFCENETMYIQCTNSHGRVHVLNIHVPDLLSLC